MYCCQYFLIQNNIFYLRVMLQSSCSTLFLHNSGNIFFFIQIVEIVYTYLFFRLRLGLEKLHIIHPLHYMGKQMKQYRGAADYNNSDTQPVHSCSPLNGWFLKIRSTCMTEISCLCHFSALSCLWQCGQSCHPLFNKLPARQNSIFLTLSTGYPGQSASVISYYFNNLFLMLNFNS